MPNIFSKLFQKRGLPFGTQMSGPLLANAVGTSFGLSNIKADATSLAAIDLIANSIAGLSVDVYDRDSRQKQDGYFLQSLLKYPNADDVKSNFFYQMTRDYFDGNVFIYLYRDSSTNQVLSMFRLDPSNVTVERDGQNRKIFTYNGKTYDSYNILHIPARWLYDGLKGSSIYDYAKSVFALNKEIDDYVNNAYNNSLGKRLKIDISNAFPNATPEQAEAIRQKYIANYTGKENAQKPIVQTNKVDFTVLDSGLPDNRASQLIENRAFQESEIGKMFPIALQILKGENSYGNIEGLYMMFVDTCLKPITNTFQEHFTKLLPLMDRDRLYVEYSFNSLLKTDLSTRISTYSTQLNSGILSINEIRSKENLPPLEDKVAGDTHFVPANLMPARGDVIDAYMASAKIKQLEVNGSTAPSVGSDKQ